MTVDSWYVYPSFIYLFIYFSFPSFLLRHFLPSVVLFGNWWLKIGTKYETPVVECTNGKTLPSGLKEDGLPISFYPRKMYIY